MAEAIGGVPGGAVEAALRAAQELGRDVADVPIEVIAARCGVSRSTLLRRLGGSRRLLDEAVRASGVDPGGAPVRVRAVDGAAAVIAENGLSAATLDAIAARADCSVPSLFAVFGTRDGVLRAVFEQYSPIRGFEEFFAEARGDLLGTVREFYGVMVRELSREPRVAPAIFAEAFARPSSPAVQALFGHAVPRMAVLVGGWLSGEIAAGRIRDLPIMLLMQQLMSPMLIHMLSRPVAESVFASALPDSGTACEVFAEAFVSAVGIP